MPTDEAIAQLNRSLAGRYTVEREIGAGGMATVYLARDVRHNRRVALKVLKPELGAMLGVERFLAEIQVTANLQHPNLLPLFDSGEAGGLLFYVMPYIEGESLRARLERDLQLPVDESVRIAAAIAGALAYAHAQGVIHRDLKPENILMQAGQPVVADFGIALAVSKAGGTRLTQTGLSLGTPQYMSPEQAMGDRPVDGRADIYSLGAVTYEMLAGEPPHTGPSAQAIMAKLMTEEVRPLTALRRSVPGHVDVAVRHALEKLPADRFATAHEFADALLAKSMQLPLRGSATGAPSPARTSGAVRSKLRDPVVVALAAFSLVSLGGWVWTREHRANPSPTSRFGLALPKDQRILDTGPGGTLAISPDGRTIAFVSQTSSSSASRIFVRPLDQVTAVPLAGTEAARDPCFSPDGRWIAFSVGNLVRKISVDGGPVETIATVPTLSVRGLSWATPSHLVAGSFEGLFELPVAGGNARLAVKSNRSSSESLRRWPLALPDGKTVLFMGAASGDGSGTGFRLGIASLETGRARTLDVEGMHPIGVLHDELVYASRAGTVMAAPFDARHGTLTGPAVVLVEDVIVDQIGDARVVLSATGTLLYLNGSSQNQPVMVDARGTGTPLMAESRGYSSPRFSPGGGRVAFAVASAQGTDIWVFDRAKTTFTRLTTDGHNSQPAWSPDGTRILFRSSREDSFEVRSVPADGNGPVELVYKNKELMNAAALSPGGEWLLYYTGPAARYPFSIFAVPLTGDRTPVPLVTGPFRYLNPRLSPDGRWMAYESDESGRFEIYVRPFPGSGARVQLSVDGGQSPLWSRAGRTLYYQKGNAIVAVAVTTGPSFSVGERTVAVAGEFVADLATPNYDVAPDGTQFLLLKRAGEDTRALVVLNWGTELAAKRAAQGAR